VTAAAALSRSLDAAGRARLASAANDCASPGVRVALRKIASSDLDEQSVDDVVASVIDGHSVQR
jgi:hypothetical protein